MIQKLKTLTSVQNPSQQLRFILYLKYGVIVVDIP